MLVVCVGECLLELSGRIGHPIRLAFGGDTLNTAVYLARLGLECAYLTALGDDPYSDELLECWHAEHVRTDLVARLPGRLPGLYAIRTSEHGERQFFYWRTASAARALLASPASDELLAAAARADVLYLSGITLSLYEPPERLRLVGLAERVRARGGQVAFDPNFRPACWPSLGEARKAVEQIASCVSFALPTLQDEIALWDDGTAETAAARWLAAGAREVAVKLGAGGVYVASGTAGGHVGAGVADHVIDTTGAGDAFNAGYLAMRLRGASPMAAARLGNDLAAIVVQHPGAIVPREATAPLCSA
ncbi:MAG TPA: sugar kinase [Steroidobacteraceae bacterium]|nr:sugar kinase [Steroidobacteraceae bacterium]